LKNGAGLESRVSLLSAFSLSRDSLSSSSLTSTSSSLLDVSVLSTTGYAPLNQVLNLFNKREYHMVNIHGETVNTVANPPSALPMLFVGYSTSERLHSMNLQHFS
jgi:hypothetical protein